MDFEYDGADDLGGRILWGRVGVLGVLVVLFFLFGRCTAGGGADPDEVAALQTELATAVTAKTELEADIASLQQQIVQLNAELQTALGGSTITGDNSGTADTTTEGTTAPQPTGGNVYVVQPGDTLSGIAEAVYGDPLQFGVIANANGITEQNPLQVGQELQIPANPDG